MAEIDRNKENCIKKLLKKIVSKLTKQSKPKTDKVTAPAKKNTREQNAKPRHTARRETRKSQRRPTTTARSPKPAVTAWELSQFQVPAVPGKTRFHDLQLPLEIMQALAKLQFQYCTPVQAMSLPPALEGKDIAAKAQTGTGKTAAFLLTALTRFLKTPPAAGRKPGAPRMLVLAPTRELVIQIHRDAEALAQYCDCTPLAVYGGMDYTKQQRQFNTPCDILVATPGRLLDFRDSRVLDLRQVEILVIDEADRMLDMGFIPDVRKIVYSLPHKSRRQTMLFSATLSSEVMRLAENWMVHPIKIEIEPEKVTIDQIHQQVYSVPARDKLALILHILAEPNAKRVLIFRNRRNTVEQLTRQLRDYNINCDQLSGDVPQRQRLKILEHFRNGHLQALVATDVAGRGIHVDAISHVINYDLPEEAEDYVHRIGRTGRAGASGIAIAFACETGAFNMMAIEKYLGQSLEYEQPPEHWLKLPERPASASTTHARARGQGKPKKTRRGTQTKGQSIPRLGAN